MKTFIINGAIVDNDSQKESFEDLTPVQLISFLNKLEDGEAVEVQINSLGGSVFAGLQIYNALRNASNNNHKVITHCTSIAASIASIIFFAGDEMIMDSNSFLCIHLPWTSGISGNAIDIRKEADTLDKICMQMIEIYSKHMKIPKDDIKSYLEAETWISASDMKNYGISDVVVHDVDEAEYRIAASIAKKFNNIPKGLIMEEKKEEVKEVKAEVEETKADGVKEQPVEEKQVEETKAEEPKECTPEVKEETKAGENEMIAKAECEKRVSGMQSAMAKKIDALDKEYKAKIEDFKNQLKAKDEELTKVNTLVTSLNAKLEDVSNELQKTASALENKTEALAKLNAGVNSPSESVNWRNLKGQQFFDYIKAHPEVAKGNK